MSKKKKTTTQRREIPAWLEAGAQQAVGLGRQIAGRPYQEYTDQRVAGLAPGEETAVNLAQEGAGAFTGDLTRSRELTERGAQSFLDTDIQQYMNPYIESALEPAARELREEMLREQNRVKSQAGMVSAFGGSRATLREEEARRGSQEGLSDLYSRGYASAFESASQRFDADRSAARQGAEQFRALGAQGQQMLTQDIQNLLTTGGLERNLKQAGLDFDYNQFIEARDWDITNLQPLLAALSTVPHGETQTTTQKTKGGEFGMVLGAAATVAGAYFGGPAGAAAGAKVFGGGESEEAPGAMVMDPQTGTMVPSKWTAGNMGLDVPGYTPTFVPNAGSTFQAALPEGA